MVIGKRAPLGWPITNPALPRTSSIDVEEHIWERMVFDGVPHTHAFLRGSEDKRLASAVATRDSVVLKGGIRGLGVLKTTGSSFVGFMKDEFTSLPAETERIVCQHCDCACLVWIGDSLVFYVERGSLRGGGGAFDGLLECLIACCNADCSFFFARDL